MHPEPETPSFLIFYLNNWIRIDPTSRVMLPNNLNFFKSVAHNIRLRTPTSRLLCSQSAGLFLENSLYPPSIPYTTRTIFDFS